MGFDAGRVDGIFGRSTERALREFQRNVGLFDDGTCRTGNASRPWHGWRAPSAVGRPHALRENEQMRSSGPGLAGKVVVLDPGHGGLERGAPGTG